MTACECGGATTIQGKLRRIQISKSWIQKSNGAPDAASRSRGAMRPSFTKIFRPSEAWGMPGADAPAVSCASKAHEVDRRLTGSTRHSRTRMVLRFPPRSPRRRIRLVTVIDGLNGLVRPGWACKTSADLTPATGARTTRLHRTRPVFAKRPRRVWYPSSEALMKTEAAPFVCAPVDRSQLSKKSRPASPLAPDAAASIAFRHRRP